MPAQLDRSGEDLRNTDLKRLALRGANLRGAILRGMRLDGVDLSGADLTGADLTSIVMRGGSLLGATLADSKWNYAAILGADGTGDPALVAAPELASAAITGRDSAEVTVDTVNAAGPCVLSPDGSLLAFGSGREVKIADPDTGRILRILRGHQYVVTAVAYSHDGTLIAAGADDGAVHIWDAASGARRTTLAAYSRKGGGLPLAHKLSVTAVAFSPDGAIATGSADGAVTVWGVSPGSSRDLHTANGAVRTVAFSPDGILLATASNGLYSHTGYTNGEVSIWDAASGTRLSRLAQGKSTVEAVAFSPDGNLIAVAFGDHAVRVCNAVTGTQCTTLSPLEGSVLAVRFSPDASLVATASIPRSGDVEVRTWDAVSGIKRTCATFANTGDSVQGASFSPNTTLVVVAYHRRAIHIRDAAREGRLTMISGPARTNSPILSRGGTRIATQSEDGITRIWDVATVTRVATVAASPYGTHRRLMALSPDGSRVATQSEDGITQIWDATGTQRGPIVLEGNRVTRLEFSANGTLVAGQLLRDRRVRVWDTTTGTLRTVLAGHGHKDKLDVFAFSPNGSLVAMSRSDGTAWIADVASGAKVAMLLKNPGNVAAREFARDYNREFTLTAIAFSPNGKLVAGASENSMTRNGIRFSFIRIWNVTGVRDTRGLRTPFLEKPTTLHGHQGRVTDLAFSQDSDLVAAASEDRTTRIWTVADDAPYRDPIHHGGPVYAVVFSADSQILMTVADDGIVHYLDIATTKPVADRVPLSDGGLATLLPDGSYRVDGDSSHHLWWSMKLCRFPPGELDPYFPEIKRLPDNASIFTASHGDRQR